MVISGDTAIIGAYGDDERGSNIGSGYMYNKIGWVWIENVKIVPEDGAADDFIGCSVAILGSTVLFGTLFLREENGSSAYVVDICVP